MRQGKEGVVHTYLQGVRLEAHRMLGSSRDKEAAAILAFGPAKAAEALVHLVSAGVLLALQTRRGGGAGVEMGSNIAVVGAAAMGHTCAVEPLPEQLT